MTIQRTSLIVLPLLSMFCAACLRTPVAPVEWPEDVPPLDYYENAYSADRRNQELQSREEYLTWVLRFYKGWDLYQDGWQMTSQDILLNVEDPSTKNRMEQKLYQLGKLLSAEWAKQSPSRAIQTRELSIWGQALLKAVNQDREEQFVDRLTRDVNALLSGEIDRTDVNLRKYVEPAPGRAGEMQL